VCFACRFVTVRPLLLSKNNGDDVLTGESPIDVCVLGVNNTCEQRGFFFEHKSPYLNVKNSEVWRKIKILALYSQFLALVHEELFPTSVLCARGSGERCTQPEQSAS
jgi:hypothetical protein